ncbi:hypothetical protein [Nitrosomonas sp. Is37]|uniref:hypothetical protein n=1 Tax=Nitrosomonas sp. Is37 TaxID=3080535 RepID=UPI00294AA767|nr:hypothetical protein [Nitrosomonas sp. Is37]MDV6343972.1 hypothetical protein [Nitrosomonas sp. Is37]
MLSAVLNGKRRGTGFAGKKLMLGETDGAEDVLTATVFERIAYLPNSVLERFFDTLLVLDEPIGSLEEIIFWPSWSLSDQRIEPDVILRGSARTLMVEAKRYDDGLQQYAKQLTRELQAGLEEEMLGDKLVLLTIGGMLDYSESTTCDLREQVRAELGPDFPDFDLFCRSWHQVFQALNSSITDAGDDETNGLYRLVNDIAEVYEWHGLRTIPYRPLGDIKSIGILVTKFPVDNFKINLVSVHKTQSSRISHPLSELQSASISFVSFPINT